MIQYRITKEQIFQATDGGLDIIRFYIPGIDHFVGTTKKFAIREEKTPSCAIKKAPDGNYLVADFGDDGRWMNGILLTQKMESCEFGEAIKIIAERHGIGSGEQIKSMYEPDVSTEDAAPNQNDGEWIFSHAEQASESHLRLLFSEKVWTNVDYEYRSRPAEERKEAVLTHFRSILKEQHWHALESYTVIKNRKAITFKATEFYPIWRIEEEVSADKRFSKIYQPKAKDKGRRFFYHGDFNPQFLHGYQQFKRAYEDFIANLDQTEEEEKRNPNPKLDEVIFCTGGSDALNFRALGYQVIYPSSEHFKLTKDQLFKLYAKATSVMTCPDLDYTGQDQNHKLCMNPLSDLYLDVRTIELPAALQNHRDQYKRSCKDLRDYLKYYKASDLKNLIKVALMYRFWDSFPAYDRKGNPKTKNGKAIMEFKLSMERVLNFLRKNGFGRRKVNDETMEFIQIDGNLVRQVRAEDIKAYLLTFLRSRFMPEDLLNVLHRSPMLSASSFDALPILDPDFRDYDMNTQYMFFKNITWKITGDGIEEIKNHNVKKMVWEKSILQHQVRKLDPMFEVTKDDLGELRLKILNDESNFFRFLTQTSRTHWQKELETNLEKLSAENVKTYKEKNKFTVFGENLTDVERRDQELHLLNKIYCFGYMVHRYKSESRPWVVFGMDDTPQKEQGSYGGTGKSVFFKGIRTIKNLLLLDGKNDKLFDDNHVFEQVTTNLDVLYIDDASERFPFERTFSMTTGDITVNPKGKTRVSIPYAQSPKIGITTNFAPNDLGSSTMRRILFFGCSNYYHVDKSGKFNENRQPIDEFGKDLWSEKYTDAEWTADLNFMAQCCQFYLSQSTWVEAPMKNIMDRSLTNLMGFNFYSWAEVFFSQESDRLDKYISLSYAMEEYQREQSVKGITSNGFNGKLSLYAQLKNFVLNPKDTQNKDGRVIKSWDILRFDPRDRKWMKSEGRKTQTMFYMQSNRKEINDIIYDPTKEGEILPPLDSTIPAPSFPFLSK